MWADISDIPQQIYVFDMEWIGDSNVPSRTHLTQIAAYCTANGNTFSTKIRPLASQATIDTHSMVQVPHDATHDVKGAIIALWDWICTQEKWASGSFVEPVVLVAHNGIRFDATILLSSVQRCGLTMPSNLIMLDSLYHVRHHLKHRDSTIRAFDIEHLATRLGIEVDEKYRHDASYDVHILHQILINLQNKWDIPYISGMPHNLQCISPMVVRGIGPTICMHMDTKCFRTLVSNILRQSGDLTESSCQTYMDGIELQRKLPAVDTTTIAANLESAACRYLHYLS